MYQSKQIISNHSKHTLAKRLEIFLQENHRIYCRALKRNISLEKLPEAILSRRKSATVRLQRFFVAIDILSRAKNYTVRESKGCLEYEILGMDLNHEKVYIHLREELSIKKDRILFFVSCY